MPRNSATEFYLKNILWIIFCLGAAGLCCAVQNIQRSGDESNAVSNIALIHRLQKQYAAKHRGRFAAGFDELIRSEKLDEQFGGLSPVIQGYAFEMKVSEAADEKPGFYSITANPLYSDGYSRHFYIDSTLTAIKRTDQNRPANAADPSM